MVVATLVSTAALVEAGTLAWQGSPQAPAAAQRNEPSVATFLQQGKSLYRIVRLKEALEKFEAALQLEPANDEALGLAAITAFRLDNQRAARDYFLRRAELPVQKDSVRAFCYYRLSLSLWREVHDLIARHGRIQESRVVHALPEAARREAESLIQSGLNYVERTLQLMPNYAEAFNTRNLLASEAALIALGEEETLKSQTAALDSLKRAIELMEQAAAAGRRTDVADFSQPTIRVGEFPPAPQGDAVLAHDRMLKRIEGGRPLQRQLPVFPTVRAPKPDAAESSTPPSAEPPVEPQPSIPIKVEILISTQGDVVFARVVEGRAEYNPAALVAVREWKFQPASLEGRPVQVSGIVTFEAPPLRRP
jgi:tetratricopeptide (TPR) repeat protein